MKVVTTGWRQTDIDAYACAVAYAELLKKMGEPTLAYLPGPLNHSVTPPLINDDFYVTEHAFTSEDSFVIVDVSEPDLIEAAVINADVVEVYDHHPGFEDFWQKRAATVTHIEPIGACATLIVEEFQKRSVTPDGYAARILLAAIVSNTLNFKAHIAKQRDKDAFDYLNKLVNLPGSWIADYYTEAEAYIYQNVAAAIAGDTKVQSLLAMGKRVAIGQIELWDGSEFIKKYSEQAARVLRNENADMWFLTVPSISEGKNHLFTTDAAVKSLLSNAIGAKFTGDVGQTGRLWLRKEILQKLLTK